MITVSGSRNTTAYQSTINKFPTISDERRQQLLAPPTAPVRLVIDTDTKNEIDDQFSLAWAFLSPDQLQVEGIYAAPFYFGVYRDALIRAFDAWKEPEQASEDDKILAARVGRWMVGFDRMGLHPRDFPFDSPESGMERSYDEILLVLEKLHEPNDNRVFRGSTNFLSSVAAPERSAAVDHLIERALVEDDRPLYVAAIGAITNIASAILIEPSIINNIVVTWTASYPSNWPGTTHSLNLEQDVLAAQVIFDSGVPLVYLPGYYIGEQLRLSLPELEAWVRGRGEIGDYLYTIFLENPMLSRPGIAQHFAYSRILWDLINIAYLINPSWTPSKLLTTPILSDDKKWLSGEKDRPLMREAFGINRNGIFEDFLTKLKKAP